MNRPKVGKWRARAKDEDRHMRIFSYSRTCLVGLGLATFIGLAGAAYAAAPAPNAPPQNLAPNAAAPAPRGYAEAVLEDWFTYQRNSLRITEAQRPLWNRYEETVRNNVQRRIEQRPVPRDPRAGPPPLTDAIAQRRQRLEAEQTRLNAIDAAIRPLYAALTEEQRRIADSVLTERPNMGRGIRDRFERRMGMRGRDRDRDNFWR